MPTNIIPTVAFICNRSQVDRIIPLEDVSRRWLEHIYIMIMIMIIIIIILIIIIIQRMKEERLPRKMLEWCPLGRRRKGRPGNSWMQKVAIEMREKGINSMKWIDREEWRRKIKLKL